MAADFPYVSAASMRRCVMWKNTARRARMPFHFIPCQIERGGFSSERTFTIKLADGNALVGTAHVDHLRSEDREPLDDGQPPFGTVLEGFVQCREIENRGDIVIVEVPSADVIQVPREELVCI
jgi:hypothetical protein